MLDDYRNKYAFQHRSKEKTFIKLVKRQDFHSSSSAASESHTTDSEQCVEVLIVGFSGSEACLLKETKSLSACVIQSTLAPFTL